jgi:hypothetical protein
MVALKTIEIEQSWLDWATKSLDLVQNNGFMPGPMITMRVDKVNRKLTLTDYPNWEPRGRFERITVEIFRRLGYTLEIPASVD